MEYNVINNQSKKQIKTTLTSSSSQSFFKFVVNQRFLLYFSKIKVVA